MNLRNIRPRTGKVKVKGTPMPAKKIAAKPEPTPEPVAVAPVPEKVHRPRAPKPQPPNPTVVAFQQQLVPLVEKREIIQQQVRQSQRALQEAQMTLQNVQQALSDTENAIQYRLNMIAQLTGQPQQMPMPASNAGLWAEQNLGGDVYPTYGGIQRGAYPAHQLTPTYTGPEVNLQGNPNIPDGITSIPAPQNQRYASGYVPTGPGNPRSESAVDVRNDPASREIAVAVSNARREAMAAQAAV
jgi:hypothetical protein